jgi:F-type H+-transporting ATPase subunit delta
MASLNTIARPYAKAVFELACQSKTLTEWGNVLRILQVAIEDKALSSLLKNPNIQPADWMHLLVSLCEELEADSASKLSDLLANFLALLVESSRLPILGEVANVFHALRLKEEGIVEVEMSSPYPVSDEERARFQQLLEKRFGGAKIQLQSSIDPSLIGGAVLRSGDWVMDGSVKRKLARLSESLSQQACYEETN